MRHTEARSCGATLFEIAHAEQVIGLVERHNARVGHENAGFLSAARGFLPLMAPRTRLSERFAAWDELAAELPALHATLGLRARIERLPLLDASSASLPADQLLRASAVLAMLTHAYWYVETDPPRAVPEVLRRPWQQTRARLGRKQAVLSYIDLIVYNWQLRDPSGPIALPNLELLLPTVGNQEERIFYLTQLEILATAAPIVQLTAAAQTAAARGDERALEQSLVRIAGCLRDCSRALKQIDPRPGAHTHVDSVRWAKSVAPFAVPIQRGDIGPSGTSSPLFNTLDIFFGRKRYDSQLGREILQLRATYPRAWRLFLAALQRLPVHAFIAQGQNKALRAAFAYALECYAGEQGFLGRHRRKVYGYLEIAFKVGRTLTIGGFSGPFAARTWNEVDDALTRARAERTDVLAAGNVQAPTASADLPRHHWSEIVAHNTRERGYWLVVHNLVYDVTHFLDRHPGGPAILRAYAGTDATHGFERAHSQNQLVARAQGASLIGAVHDPAPQLTAAQAHAHGVLVRALQLVAEMQGALELNLSFSLLRGATATAYDRQRERERAERFEREYVAPLQCQLLPQLRAALLPLHPELALLPQPDPHRAAHDAHRNRTLLRELKRGLVTILRPLERADVTQSSRRTRTGWLRLLAALQRHAARNAGSAPA